MKVKIIQIVGWYGVIAILGAYTLVSFSVFQPTGLFYQLLNATGAVGIVVAALSKKDYQPAVLNVIWTVIAIVAIIKIAIK